MKKFRIIERTFSNGEIVYIIQKRFLWWWLDYEDEMAGYMSFADYKTAKNFYDRISPKTFTDKIIVTRKDKLEKLLA